MVPEKLSLILFKFDKNISYDIVLRRLEIVRLPDKQYSDMLDVETELVAKSKDSPYFSLIVDLLFYRQSLLTYECVFDPLTRLPIAYHVRFTLFLVVKTRVCGHSE